MVSKIIRRLLLAASVILSIQSQAQIAPLNATGAKPQIFVLEDQAYGVHEKQKMDIYLPSFPINTKNRPAILMVHGGAWTLGDKTDAISISNKLTRWVPNGIIFASTNYRSILKAKPNRQARDVAKAMALIQRKMKAWGGDPSNVVLMGHSSGAYLASLLAANPDIAYEEGAQPWLGTIAVNPIALDTIDLMENDSNYAERDAFGSDHNYWASVSPLHVLQASSTPVLFVCSTIETPDNCNSSETFKLKAKELSRTTKIIKIALEESDMIDSLGLSSQYTNVVEGFIYDLFKKNPINQK